MCCFPRQRSPFVSVLLVTAPLGRKGHRDPPVQQEKLDHRGRKESGALRARRA